MMMTFDKAIELLDEYMQTKTVHSVQSITAEMQMLCGMKFVKDEDQQDFANICSNFDKYCQVHKMTSFGRKQFEAAWEKNFYVENTLENAVKMLEKPIKNTIPDIISEALEEDRLPEDLFRVRPAIDVPDSWEPCMKTHSWNSRECSHCRIQELEAEVRELRKSLKGIKELLTPWA